MLKISAIIPVYNGAQYIKEAVQSIFAQTLLPAELIVVDDGSTDSTDTILQELKKKAPIEMQIIRQNNQGLAAARNTGIKNSRSDFLAFLDADDLWHPDKLKKQSALFDIPSFENLGVVYCNYDNIDANGKPWNKDKTLPLHPYVRGNIYSYLLYGNFVASSGSGVLCKKACFNSIGLFDETLSTSEDWDMWLRISKKYQFDFIPDVLVHLRRHSTNMSLQVEKMFSNDLLVIQKQHQSNPTPETQKAVLFWIVRAPSVKTFCKIISNKQALAKSGPLELAPIILQFVQKRLKQNLKHLVLMRTLL